MASDVLMNPFVSDGLDNGTRNKQDATQKIASLPGTLFLPLIGPLIFFIKFSSFKKPSTQA